MPSKIEQEEVPSNRPIEPCNCKLALSSNVWYDKLILSEAVKTYEED
jgi:hypothetical protein